MIGQAVDDAYMAELKKQIIHMDAIQAEGKNLEDRLHRFTEPVISRPEESLKELGFENVYVVPEQELPGWRFPDSQLSEPGGGRGI